ncbi:MAG TPA: acyl-CoA thioesterase domain-containing protein, partial [Mycobacterium sp.]|nr:acyl-CoA thioesterase domain-containing protein [Mycobacterium sp.]
MTTQGRAADVPASSGLPTAFFVADADTFVPTSIARGPWGQTISGNFVGGLLGHAVERAAGDPDFQPTRLTVDLFRPAALEPVRVDTTVARTGRRLRLVDAVMTQAGAVVARASALFLRRGEQPDDEVWSTPVTMPPLPPMPDPVPDNLTMLVWTYGRNSEAQEPDFGLSGWQHAGPKYVWVRDIRPLVEGEALTPFIRAAMAGDMTSSLTHYGTGGLNFINADYTLTLSRLPEGPYIGLAALTHYSHAGVATGVATIVDQTGPIGSGVATALSNPG